MPAVVQCRVLGPVELTLRGTEPPAELLWRKNVALLLVLARSPGRQRTRDQLMGLLWSEKPERAARHSLNEALSVLRRHLGDDAVITRGEDVRLQPDVVDLDADTLGRLLDRDDVAAAAELVRGEFMDGFAIPDEWEFEEWLAAERRLWKHRAVAAVADAGARALATGSTSRARILAERALRLEPLTESAVRTLMLAHALAGNRSTALSEFRRFSQALESELGIAPAAETDALAARIRAEREWDLPITAHAPAKDDTRSWPLVGRGRELRALLDQWDVCRAQQRTTACAIVGDAGMGKSRLAEELLARARLNGARTATTRAVPGDRALRWNGLTGLDKPGAQPAVHAGETSVDPIRHFIDSLAPAESPVAIFIDDAQWLDPDSLRALRALLRDAAGRSVLLLLAVGPGPAPELDALLARIGRDAEGAILRLGPLDSSALSDLVREVLPEYGAAEHDRLVRRLLADSAGVPFIANALLRAITVGLDLHELSGAWPAPFRTLDHTLPAELPRTVIAAIRVDFRRLTAAAQQALCAIALSDEPATPEPIASATGMSTTDLTRALDELEWSRWVVSDRRGYTFVAQLLRQVVAEEMLSPGQRRRLTQALSSG